MFVKNELLQLPKFLLRVFLVSTLAGKYSPMELEPL
jgi:hypothetical protein